MKGKPEGLQSAENNEVTTQQVSNQQQPPLAEISRKPVVNPMLVSFACGMAYGATSVLVGQPFDTIKTRMQAMAKFQNTSWHSTWNEVFAREGLQGLYRGGLPLIFGGALIRSAQFGFYDNSLTWLQQHGRTQGKLFNLVDYNVVCAGFVGGIGRGLVEGPVEFIKVRRQVEHVWTFRDFVRDFSQGGAVTMTRNAFLFMFFAVYIDLSKQVADLGPFATGSICANLAWLTIWPMDVIKSQIQSGNYEGKSMLHLLRDVSRSGMMFRGIVPGLIRSTIANGSGMVAYKYVDSQLHQT